MTNRAKWSPIRITYAFAKPTTRSETARRKGKAMLHRESEIGASKNGTRWAFPFFFFWTCQAITLLGCRLASFVLTWYLTETTGSATVLTSALLFYLLPQIFLGPLAGALIDRWSRKRVMVASDLILALATFGLASMSLFGGISLSSIYAWMFIQGLAIGFINPAMLATTTLMVPSQHLTRIQGINQTLQGGLSIVYAPLGALLYSSLPMQSILSLASAPALIAATCLFFIGIPQPLENPQMERRLIRELKIGLRYIFDKMGLRILIGISVVLNFLDAIATALIPLLVAKYYKGNALQLGWMNSTFGAGVILGGLILSAWGGFRRNMVTSLLGICGIGVGALLMGMAPVTAFWLAIGGILVKGIMQAMANGPVNATLQSAVDPAMQGRVISLVISLATAAAPLGLLFAGQIGDRLGVQVWFTLLGGASILVGASGFLFPSLVQLGRETYSE